MWAIINCLIFSCLLYNNNLFVWCIVIGFSIISFIISSWSGGFCDTMVFDTFIQLDNLNLFFVILSLVIYVCVILLISTSFYRHLVTWLVVSVVVFFLSSNFILLYIFFELSIVPIFIIVVYLGKNPERLNASFYLMIYTLIGSMPLLFALVLIWSVNTFSLVFCLYEFYIFSPDMVADIYYVYWGWLFLIVGFFIKLPLFGVHLWLPKAHVEATTEGSMLLASILLKLGVFGVLRVSSIMVVYDYPIYQYLICWGVLGVMVMGFVCFRNVDMKMLIAYSSVVHMILVVFCFTYYSNLGNLGCVLLSVGHGVCSSLLFYNVGLMYNMSGSRNILVSSGLINIVPVFCFFWLINLFLNSNFPPSINFFSEVVIFYSLGFTMNFLVWLILFTVFVGGLFNMYLFMVNSHGKINYNLQMVGNITLKQYFIIFLHIIINLTIVLWIVIY
uniref:NADH-ubiquinone oxidoreductase chain 4 n=1 Tax=Vorticeros sp. n. MW-2019 TaxID=2544881 RepID=A0AA50A9A1_9PLAT|nr:NADH dehydrogenase subunit 4 [Vorticeros sp. n. MW-2019]